MSGHSQAVTQLIPPHDPQGEPCIVSVDQIVQQCGADIGELCKKNRRLSPNQLFLYCITYKSVVRLAHGEPFRLIPWDGILGLLVCWLTVFLSSLISHILTDVVAGAWALIFLVTTLRGLKIGSPKSVHFPHETRDRLILGRIRDLVGRTRSTVAFYCHSIVILTMLQFLLLWYTTNHLSIGDLSPRDAVMLGLDTVFQSVSFGLFEQYHPHLSQFSEKLPFLASSVFFFFKVSYAGFTALILASLWRSRKSQPTFPRLPAWGDIDGFMEWLHVATTPTHFALNKYLDDFVFLLVLREYLRGNYERVTFLANSFSSVLVANSVRCLFVDPITNKPLFQHRRGYVDDNKWIVILPE